MLALLLRSGIATAANPEAALGLPTSPKGGPRGGTNDSLRRLVRALAVVQTLLAVLALTSYHVQIINRISSGYPVYFWWLANAASAPATFADRRWAKVMIVFGVAYGMVQAAPFASFMPPA